MARRRASCLVPVAALVVVLAVPSVASAATFCVPSCPPGVSGTAHGSLQSAFTAADATPAERDTVHIAAGFFDGAHDVNSPVDIIGAGRGLTIVRGPATDATTALNIDDLSSTVSDLSIRLGAAFSVKGLVMLGGTAERLDIVSPDGASFDRGVEMPHDGVTLRQVSVDMPVHGTDRGVGVFTTVPGAEPVIEDSTITGSSAVETVVDGTLRVRRSTITGNFGLYNQGGGMEVQDVLVRVLPISPGVVTVHGITTDNSTTDAFTSARHATVVGDGAGGSNSTGFVVEASGGGTATLNVSNSIARGLNGDLRARTFANDSSTATLAVDHSNFDPAKVAAVTGGPSSPATVNQGAGNTNLDPQFVNPGGGNYSLRPTSPLIDLGDPAALAAGESSSDRGGQPRVTDGTGDCVARRDMGAFEFQAGPRPPRAAAAANPGTARAGAPVTFDAAGSCDPDADEFSFTWAFDDGGTASGRSVGHAFATPGLHTGTVTVTDATGRTDSATTAVLVIPDRQRPTVDASITNSVFARGSAATPVTLAGRRVPRGTTFRYTLSEPASVAILIERKLPGRRRGSRCERPSRRNARGRRCTRLQRRGTLTRAGTTGRNDVPFSGRIGRRAQPLGSYRASFTATDAAGNKSRADRLNFRIVRPRLRAPQPGR